MKTDPLSQLRKLCLALPEATEKIAWGEPTFRVREKIFAMFTNNHHGDGRVAVWVKGPKDVQEILVGADPKRFFVPPYVGHKGWIGVRLDLDDVDWNEVADILRDGYRLTAPPGLAAQLDAGAGGEAPVAEAAARARVKNNKIAARTRATGKRTRVSSR